MTNATTVLEVRNLAVRYGLVAAVSEISLAVERGRITTIIGSNGAGKTTILKALARLIPSETGEVAFEGKTLTGLDPEEVASRGLRLVLEGRRLFYTMTVRENLELGAWRRRNKDAIRHDLEKVLEYFPALRERLGSKAMTLSGGQQQMVALGRALMGAPRLLMMDEPSIGLAPSVVETIGNIICTIRDQGVDVLLVEQNARMALNIADDAYVMENGRILKSGKTKDIAADGFVRATYLGM